MDCTNFQTRFDDWLDGALNAEGSGWMARHERNCRRCQVLALAERRQREALRALPAADPAPGFLREALRAARIADRASRRELRRHYLRLAAVASLAALAVVYGNEVLLRGADGAGSRWAAAPQQTYTLTTGEVRALRLRIESPRDFEGVRFSVELPDQVFLAGQPGIRAMTWEGSLRKGENVLELPLVAQAGASGRVATRVSWGDFEQRLETELVSVPALRNRSLYGQPQSGA